MRAVLLSRSGLGVFSCLWVQGSPCCCRYQLSRRCLAARPSNPEHILTKMEGGKRSRIENLRPLPLASGTHGHGHHGSLQPENFASVDPSPGLISMRMDTFRDEITVDDSMNNSMDQSLPPSPATSTREGDMSVSDLTSIGFDSNMSSDLHSQGFLSDKSAAPSTPLKPREARDETDPLAALLREPQYRYSPLPSSAAAPLPSEVWGVGFNVWFLEQCAAQHRQVHARARERCWCRVGAPEGRGEVQGTQISACR